jgi:predicted acyltransferase
VNSSNSQRWLALDFLRGLSVIGMLLVVNPGDWAARFPQLDHVAWVGLSAADMIFPSFLFCVGVALPLVVASRLNSAVPQSLVLLQIWKRSLALILLGLALNAFPEFNVAQLRLPGVLQRIGLCYGLVGSLVLLSTSVDTQRKLVFERVWIVLAIAIIAVGYWVLLTFVPSPQGGAPAYDSANSWPAYIDRQIFSVAHLWVWGLTDGQVTYDPEGVLSTLPACINVLIGVLVGHNFLSGQLSKRMSTAWIAGVALVLVGLMWGLNFPLIKKLWTSSFALFSSGVSLVLLLGFCYLDKFQPWKKIVYPVAVFGSNALLAFSLSGVISPLMDKPWLAGEESFRHWGQGIMLQMISNVHIASLVFSALVISGIFLVLNFCYRSGWLIRL